MQISRENTIKDQKGKYVIERLDKENLVHVGRLHHRIYGHHKAADHFLKKYGTSFIGIENIGYIAYDGANQPIAFFGIIPCFLYTGKELLMAGQAADGMTDPTYRSLGLFVELASRAAGLAKQEGIKLLFGFPNQDSFPPMIGQLDWKDAGRMSRFEIQVNRFWNKLFGTKLTRVNGDILEFFPPEIGFPNSVLRDGFIGIHRDRDYMKYKSFSNTSILKMNNADVWAKIGRQFIIGDINLKTQDALAFFEELKAVARKLKCTGISFQTCAGSQLHGLFGRYCKELPSFPVLFKDLGSGIPTGNVKFNFADIDIF